MNYFGLMALVSFRLNELEECYQIASTALLLLKHTEPTTFTTFLVYYSLAETLLLLYHILSKQTTNRGFVKPEKVLASAEKAVSHLVKFSKSFTFAQPRADMWSGFLNLKLKKSSNAEKDFTRSLESANKLGMKYEQALCLYEKGLASNNSVCAIEIS